MHGLWIRHDGWMKRGLLQARRNGYVCSHTNTPNQDLPLPSLSAPLSVAAMVGELPSSDELIDSAAARLERIAMTPSTPGTTSMRSSSSGALLPTHVVARLAWSQQNRKAAQEEQRNGSQPICFSITK